MTNQRRCSHPVLQIMEFNTLGVVVGCVICDATFDLEQDEVEARYIPFQHTSPQGRAEDRFLLVSEEQIT